MSFEAVVDKIGEVIASHGDFSNGSFKSLDCFEKWELKYFPVQYLINNARASELSAVWFNLPERYRLNADLQDCLPCFKHHTNSLDGPPPKMKNCVGCRYPIEV